MDQVILCVGVVVVGVFGLLGVGFVRQPAYRRLGVADFVKSSLQRVADGVANVLDSDRGRVSRLVRGVGAAVLAQSARTSAGTFTLPGSVVVFSGTSDYAVLAGEAGESVVRSVNQELSGLPSVVGASQMVFRLDESLSPGQIRVSLPGDVEVPSGVVGVVSGGYVEQGRTTELLVDVPAAPGVGTLGSGSAGVENPDAGAPDPNTAGDEAPTKVDPHGARLAAAAAAGGGVDESVTSHLESASPQALSVSGAADCGGRADGPVHGTDGAHGTDRADSAGRADSADRNGAADAAELKSASAVLSWGVDDVEGEPTEQPVGRDATADCDGDVDTAEPGLGLRVPAERAIGSTGDVPEPGSDASDGGDAGGVAVTAMTPVVGTAQGAGPGPSAGASGGLGHSEASTEPLSRCFVIGPDGQSYALSRAGLIVGRAPDCDIVVQDVHASAKHARFSLTSTGVRVEDLGATNGVLVNHRLVHGSAELRSEDNVIIGQTIYRVESVGRVGGN